jgi:hypothetical protein
MLLQAERIKNHAAWRHFSETDKIISSKQAAKRDKMKNT